MKRTGTFRWSLLLALVFALTAGTSWAALTDADAVFLTVDNTYTAAALGTIEVSSPDVISKNLVTGLGGDPMGFVVEIWGEKKILIREYKGSGTADTVSLYPGEDWSGPVAQKAFGDNIQQAQVEGDYLYVANWGNTGLRAGSIEQYDIQDFLDGTADVEPVETLSFDDGDAFTDQVKDFRIVDGYLYALVSDVDGTFTYDAGRLYKISLPDMTVVDSLNVGKNPGGAVTKAAMALYGNALYVACFGGGYVGALEPSLVKVNLATFTATVIDDGSALPDTTYGYCGLAVASDGALLVNVASSNWLNPTLLYRTTVGGLEAAALADDFWEDKEVDLSEVAYGLGIGFGGTLFFDGATDRFWVEGSYAAVTIDRAGALLRAYEATDLGGNPYDILPAAGLSFSGEILRPSGGSSGGCNGGFVPAGLLLLVPLLLLSGRR